MNDIDRKTSTINIITVPTYAMECLICGESVDLTDDEKMCIEYGKSIQPKICDKCRQAIMRIRNSTPIEGKDVADACKFYYEQGVRYGRAMRDESVNAG